MGRPKQTVSKDSVVNLRTTKDLRERLDQAAEATGRTLAQEVEARLEQSLRDNPPGRVAFSDVTRNFARIVGLCLSHIEQVADRRWIETKSGCEAARAAVSEVFREIQPPVFDGQPMTAAEAEEAKHLSAAGIASARFLTHQIDFSQYQQEFPTPIANKLMRATGSE